MKREDRTVQYTAKILSALQTLFDEDSENYISGKELKKENNLTHFFHALANITPNILYSKITGEETDILEFNHIANKLVFQYASKDEEEK